MGKIAINTTTLRIRPCAPRSALTPFAWLAVAALSVGSAGVARGVICFSLDDGSGTAVLPPTCITGYLSPAQVHMIINGLPAGTTIIADASHSRFGITNSGPGGSLGGEFEQFSSFLNLNLQGTGSLAGFTRAKQLQLQCETHIGPRLRGQPVQSFDTSMFMMQGQLPPGDPDFDLLRITGGSGMGMPSPGHTTLTQSPGGQWAVDSFFDITYRIEFIGHSPGPLAGMSGSTTATIRMRAGEPTAPIYCRCKGDSDANGLVEVTPDMGWFAGELLKGDDADPCADMDDNGDVNSGDIKQFISAVLSGGGCPALDAWETPDSTGSPLTSTNYEFGTGGNPPIPADFFAPGSLPFTGIVLFSPSPLDPLNIGETDTIVRRPPLPPIPPGPPIPVAIEMMELSLVSASPITVNTGTGTEQWMVCTAISDTPAPGGIMNVSATGPNGGTFSATINVRPVFAFVRVSDLQALQGGLIDESQVETRIMDTGDPGSPVNPLQLQFGGGQTQSPWVSQACGQVISDGLFFFHNQGFPFIPGVQGPLDPCEAFKPGPMKHVRPGEAHYVAPPNKRPGVTRCVYQYIGRRIFCRAGKVGRCPPAPAIICTKICPAPVPCSPFLIRIVRTRCRPIGGIAVNRGWCFQFYRQALPPNDCAVCP